MVLDVAVQVLVTRNLAPVTARQREIFSSTALTSSSVLTPFTTFPSGSSTFGPMPHSSSHITSSTVTPVPSARAWNIPHVFFEPARLHSLFTHTFTVESAWTRTEAHLLAREDAFRDDPGARTDVPRGEPATWGDKTTNVDIKTRALKVTDRG